MKNYDVNDYTVMLWCERIKWLTTTSIVNQVKEQIVITLMSDIDNLSVY